MSSLIRKFEISLAAVFIGISFCFVVRCHAALVSHYKFDGSVANVIENAPDGIAVNSPSYTHGFDGKVDGAILLNGLNQYIQTSIFGLPGRGKALPSGSLSFWVKADDNSHNNAAIMGSLNTRDWMGFIVQLNDATTPADVFRVYIRDEDCVALAWRTSDADARWRDGTWHHFAVVWDCAAGEVEIYADGQPYSMLIQSGGQPDNFGWPWQYGMTIGALNVRGTVQNYFSGAIDDLRIYDEKLAVEEIAELSMASTGPAKPLGSSTWVATDELGRSLPGYRQCGPVDPGKYVGIFYFALHHDYLQYPAWNTTEILEANPANPQWGPELDPHWWDEPEIGYYSSDDPWVIRRHLIMLANAGVDVLIIDATNYKTYREIYMPLCLTARQLRNKGYAAPKITFATYKNSADRIKQLYEEFYSKGYYPEMWFYWQGKPLLLGYPDQQLSNGEYLSEEIKNFFTFRESWSQQTGYHRWPWVDTFPQDYGWDQQGKAEQMPVQAASHPCQLNIGRSYHDGEQPVLDQYHLTGSEHLGLNSQEQWDRALQFDPNFIFITSWNEWEQCRFVYDEKWGYVEFLGQPLQYGETFFADVYNREYSRDIEPMKDGFTDNYYYQMVANIRKFKGVSPPETPSSSQTILIDGLFSEWDEIKPEYRDVSGDTLHRSFAGRGGNFYTDFTGRNDFVLLKVAYDTENVYFYAQTNEDITEYTDPNWMLLFIDSDRDVSTGLHGYDHLVNMDVGSDIKTTLKAWNGAGDWQTINSNIEYRCSGNRIELQIPRLQIGQGTGVDLLSFDFHWADNVRGFEDITKFSVSGDSAPDRRFNYRYESVIAETACSQYCDTVGGLDADRNFDCAINIEDLLFLIEAWVSDFGFGDFTSLAVNWLANYTPQFLSDVVLLRDDFETGLGKWSTSWELSTAESFSPTTSVQCTSEDINHASSYFDTRNYKNITLSFKYMAQGLNSNKIYVQCYNGSSWVIIDSIGGCDQNVWLYYKKTLSNSALGGQFFNDYFRINLAGEALNPGEIIWVDDVLLTAIE